MLGRIVIATIVAGGTYIGCRFIGALFAEMGVPLIATVGGFLVEFAEFFGIGAGLLYFFKFGNRVAS